MSTLLKIAVAEPSVIIRSGVLAVLKRLTALNIQVLEIAEISQLNNSINKQKPDILIINPALLGMFSLQQLKNEANCKELKCIALQFAMADTSTLKANNDINSTDDTAEQIKEKILRLNSFPDKQEEKHETLSSREKEIISYVVKGYTNKQIAEQLYLSTHTVITHRRNIANKLQIHSPAGLTIYAIVNKLVELDDIKK